ncbi:MAG: hypothetical protein Q8O38_10590 [Sulfurimicrobium sp.]|nr:hypothetical protein [Sulfurimicrobium sp.]
MKSIKNLLAASVLATAMVTLAHADDSAPSAAVTPLIPIELTYIPGSNTQKVAGITDIPANIRPVISAKKREKGGYLIEGTGSYKAGAPCFAYEYKINIKNKTYTLTPLALELDDSYLKLQGINTGTNLQSVKSTSPKYRDIAAEPGTTGSCGQQVSKKTNNGVTDTNTVISAISPGSWWGKVTMRTRDIPNWTITKTTDYLEWTSFSNGTVRWDYWQVTWYAVNPSPINTHWYVSQQNHYGPTYGSGNTTVNKGVYGAYYNYDWGFDHLSTNAYQSASITGRNDSTFNYFWTHNDSGEDASLIWGVVTLN